MKQWSLCVVVGAVILLAPVESNAQTMYRCGSNYQDKPCAQGQVGKVIGNQASRDESASPAIDAACRRRGEAAKKIIWSRKGGASKDDLLAGVASMDESRLIEDVYAIKGDYTQIRKTIETECMAAKEGMHRPDGVVNADTLRLAREVQDKLRAEQIAAQGDDGKSRRTPSTTKNASLCENFKMQADMLDAGIKASSDQATILVFQKKKDELAKARSAASCP